MRPQACLWVKLGPSEKRWRIWTWLSVAVCKLYWMSNLDRTSLCSCWACLCKLTIEFKLHYQVCQANLFITVLPLCIEISVSWTKTIFSSFQITFQKRTLSSFDYTDFWKASARESFQCRQVNLSELQFHLPIKQGCWKLKDAVHKVSAITNTQRSLRKGIYPKTRISVGCSTTCKW